MKDCTVQVLGKNGQELIKASIPFNAENPSKGDVIPAIVEMYKDDLNSLLNILNDNSQVSEDTMYSMLFGPAGKDNYENKILGSYSANNVVNKLQDRGILLSNTTKRLLELANIKIINEGSQPDFILVTNNKIQGSYQQGMSFPINGVVARNNSVNPLIIIDGTDAKTVDNTLRHELVHLIWDKVIEMDQDIQNLLTESFNKLDSSIRRGQELLPFASDNEVLIKIHSKISKHSKNPKEIFAYLYSTYEGRNYLNIHNPDVILALEKHMPLYEPKKSAEDLIQANYRVEFDSIPTLDQYVSHSGGAVGSDHRWGVIGEQYGVKTNHFYVEGFKTTHGNVAISQEEAAQSDEHLKRANKSLKRNFPTSNEYTNNLLRRNWLQVSNADSIYAIGKVMGNMKFVDGGTGWAVQMAIDNDKPVFVYCTERKNWYTYNGNNFQECDVPILTPNFAGIGTRGDKNNPTQYDDVIKEVYEKTKNNISSRQVEPINIWAGSNENADLSNFAIRPFDYEGVQYQSVEQFFQHNKALFANDLTTADKILKTTNGSTLKKLGNSVKGLNVSEWDVVSEGIMYYGMLGSFMSNPAAKQRLIDTGEAVLTHSQDKGKWGKLFPELLTKIRKELKDYSDTSTLESLLSDISDDPSLLGNLSFEGADVFVSNDKKLPRLSRSQDGSGFINIQDAYNYLEENKSQVNSYWSEPIDSNKRNLRTISTGDLIQINSLTWITKDVLKEIGLLNKYPTEYGMLLSIDQIMSELESIQESKRTSGQNKFLKDANNIKYRKYKRNYIVGGSFYHSKAQARLIIVPVNFNGTIKQVYINTSNVQISNFRKLDEAHKTYYQYDKDGKIMTDSQGNPIIKQTQSVNDVNDVSPEQIRVAQDSLKNLNSVKNDLKLDPDKTVLQKVNYGNGQFFIKGGKNGILFTGFAGDLVEQSKDAESGDYVRYRTGWTEVNGKKKGVMEFGVKIKNTPGGIMILTESGERKIISHNGVVSVIFNKQLFKDRMLDEVKELANKVTGKNGKNRRSFIQSMIQDDNISIFPYFSKDANKEDLNKNLKKGDLVLVRFFPQPGQPQDILASVLYATSNKIYYTTQSEEYPVIEIDTSKTTDEKWVERGKDSSGKTNWEYGSYDSNNNFIKSTSKTPIVLAAYQENNDKALNDYLKDIKQLHQDTFSSNKKIAKSEEFVDIETLVSDLVGENMGNDFKKDENGKIVIPLCKTSIDSEWDVTYSENMNEDQIIDLTNDMIKGDLVLVEYGEGDDIKSYWAMFKGYNYKTGEPKVIGVRKNPGKFGGAVGKSFSQTVPFSKIKAVGKRTLPITRFKQTVTNPNGTVTEVYKFANTDDVETLNSIEGISDVRIISLGRPEKLNRLKERVKEFINKDRKIAVLTDDELAKNMDKIKHLTKFAPNQEGGLPYQIIKVRECVNPVTSEVYFHEKPYDGDHFTGNTETRNIIKVTTKSNKSYFINNINLNPKYNQVYSVGKYGFDDVKRIATEGDFITYEVTSKNGNKDTYSGIVTGTSNSYVEMSFYKRNKEDGTLMPKRIAWFKNDKNIRVVDLRTTNISEACKIRDEKVKNNNTNQSQKTKSTNNQYKTKEQIVAEALNKTFKRSKNAKSLRKSYDSRETIIRVADKLQSIYNHESHVYTNDEMQQLGEKFNIKLGDVRGFAVDGAVYINIDKASTADYLHEMTHILLPGLKQMNPEAYKIIMSKIKQHPLYDNVVEAYPELQGHDLDDEVFCTIFGEYFREKMLSKDQEKWLSDEFTDFTSNVPSVVSELFETSANGMTGELMGMTLDEIMMEFGSSLIKGDYKKAYDVSVTLHVNSLEQKIYRSLIDSGELKKQC